MNTKAIALLLCLALCCLAVSAKRTSADKDAAKLHANAPERLAAQQRGSAAAQAAQPVWGGAHSYKERSPHARSILADQPVPEHPEADPKQIAKLHAQSPERLAAQARGKANAEAAQLPWGGAHSYAARSPHARSEQTGVPIDEVEIDEVAQEEITGPLEDHGEAVPAPAAEEITGPLEQHDQHEERSAPAEVAEAGSNDPWASARGDGAFARSAEDEVERTWQVRNPAERHAASVANAANDAEVPEAGANNPWDNGNNNNNNNNNEHARNVANEPPRSWQERNPAIRHQKAGERSAQEVAEHQEALEAVHAGGEVPQQSHEEHAAMRRKIQDQRHEYLYQQQVELDKAKTEAKKPHPADTSAPADQANAREYTSNQPVEEKSLPAMILYGLPILGIAGVVAAAALFVNQMKPAGGYQVVPGSDDPANKHTIAIAPSPLLKATNTRSNSSTDMAYQINNILNQAGTPNIGKGSKGKLTNSTGARRSPNISTARLRSSQTFTQI